MMASIKEEITDEPLDCHENGISWSKKTFKIDHDKVGTLFVTTKRCNWRGKCEIEIPWHIFYVGSGVYTVYCNNKIIEQINKEPTQYEGVLRIELKGNEVFVQGALPFDGTALTEIIKPDKSIKEQKWKIVNKKVNHKFETDNKGLYIVRVRLGNVTLISAFVKF